MNGPMRAAEAEEAECDFDWGWRLKMPPDQKMLLFVLAFSARPHHRAPFPPIADLIRFTSMTLREVLSAFVALEAAGLVAQCVDDPGFYVLPRAERRRGAK